MYINLDLLEKHDIIWKDNKYIVLQCIKQKEYERLEDCKDILNELWKGDYLTLIKKTSKNIPNYMRVRLSKKGKMFLKDSEIVGITPEGKKLAALLIELYDNRNLKIANKKKVVELISWFLMDSGFEPRDVYQTVEYYVISTGLKYISNLNNLIWKGENLFATNWNLSDSKLYGLMTK